MFYIWKEACSFNADSAEPAGPADGGTGGEGGNSKLFASAGQQDHLF